MESLHRNLWLKIITKSQAFEFFVVYNNGLPYFCFKFFGSFGFRAVQAVEFCAYFSRQTLAIIVAEYFLLG
jgi:hypothetical protein